MPAYEDIKIGDNASFSKTITEYDIYAFAGVTGDLNPAHIDEEYSKKTMFKGRIAHGMLSVGFISAVLANRLPGPGTIYLSQNVKFKAPVRIGDTVTATCTVKDKDDEKRRITLETTVANQNGVAVIDGTAVVMLPA